MLSVSDGGLLCPITLLFVKVIGTLPERPRQESEFNVCEWASGGFPHFLRDGVDKSLSFLQGSFWLTAQQAENEVYVCRCLYRAERLWASKHWEGEVGSPSPSLRTLRSQELHLKGVMWERSFYMDYIFDMVKAITKNSIFLSTGVGSSVGGHSLDALAYNCYVAL